MVLVGASETQNATARQRLEDALDLLRRGEKNAAVMGILIKRSWMADTLIDS
jgi:hypothetical protein